MAFQVPTEEGKRWIQPNKSDVFGNLFATWNMDFNTSLGKARVSRRMRINTDETDDAQLGLPFAFIRSAADGTDRWWAACGDRFFKTTGTDPTAAFTEDSIGGTPTSLTLVSSDVVEYNGDIIASTSTDLVRLTGGVWDTDYWTGASPGLGQSALTASIPHPLCVTKKTNLFLIGSGNAIHTVNTDSNVSTRRVVLPIEFQIIWMVSSDDGTWIGARNTQSRYAEVFFWDEYSENYNRGYNLKSDHTFAGVIGPDGLCYAVNGAGQLLKFTGNGFGEVAVFPNFEQQNRELDDGQIIRRNIHQNGIAIIDNKIHILIASQINNAIGSFMPNFPSGVWTYEEELGLRHKYSVSQYDGTEIDYGCMALVEPGALISTSKQEGLFLVGADVFTSATVDINSILYLDTNDSLIKRGHFVTSIFESSSFEDIFQDLLVKFKRFRSASDRIIVKYREIKNPNYPIASTIGTWSSTTVFTSTSDLSNVVAGDEVMIIRGRGAGTTAIISTITEAGGTYTVTLDEVITNASGTLTFSIDNWTRCATISTQSIDRQAFDLDVPGTFLQLKVELRSASGSAGAGDSPELEKIIVNNKAEYAT